MLCAGYLEGGKDSCQVTSIHTYTHSTDIQQIRLSSDSPSSLCPDRATLGVRWCARGSCRELCPGDMDALWERSLACTQRCASTWPGSGTPWRLADGGEKALKWPYAVWRVWCAAQAGLLRTCGSLQEHNKKKRMNKRLSLVGDVSYSSGEREAK